MLGTRHSLVALLRATLYATLVLSCAAILASCGLTTVTSGAGQTPVVSTVPASTTTTATATAAQGTLTGDVVTRPNCPVQSAASPCMSTPVATRDVTITPSSGATTTATTDGNGHFSVVLAPGAYTVQVAMPSGSTAIKQPTPVHVTIAAGQSTYIKIMIDTGIRSASTR